MAEAVFRNMIAEKGLANKIEVDSAGTANWHTGKPPHEGTREILDKYRISYKGMHARQIQENDLKNFTYIIAMDEQNVMDLRNEFGNYKEVTVRKLMDFVKDPEELNVPDPYYTGDFDYTYELITTGCEELLKHIRSKHNI